VSFALDQLANIRMRVPIQYFHPSSRCGVSQKMTVRRFVPSAEHDAEGTQLDVGSQSLPETLLVLLHVARDRNVTQVPRPAQQLVEAREPCIGRKSVQGGANGGRPSSSTHTTAVPTNPFVGGKTKDHDLGRVPGAELAAQKPG
jgi:hypothetical protein